ncbi:hypothetical protein [Priestia filamentosa]|uniref:hypothetical protein n=1 Tax=Priestia filamentosa TaxID=1402861 RepID=UPI002E1DE080|nr:hypothetical protein [Priestia filamentosa]
MQSSYSSDDYQGHPRPRLPYYPSYPEYYPGYPIYLVYPYYPVYPPYPYRFEDEQFGEQFDEDLQVNAPIEDI